MELTLRWDKFGLNRGLHEMLGSGDLVDVTLACQGEFLQAHKTVLAACSPHFRELFKGNPCRHPIVILQDVNLVHLKNILHFMYLGEATVLQDQLQGFLHTADTLGVTALAPKPKLAVSSLTTAEPPVAKRIILTLPPTNIVVPQNLQKSHKHKSAASTPLGTSKQPEQTLPTTPAQPPVQQPRQTVHITQPATVQESVQSRQPVSLAATEPGDQHYLARACSAANDLGLYQSEVLDLPLADDLKIEIDDEDGLQIDEDGMQGGEDEAAENLAWSLEPRTARGGQPQPPESSENVSYSRAVQMNVHPIQTVNVPYPGSFLPVMVSNCADPLELPSTSRQRPSTPQPQPGGSWFVESQNMLPKALMDSLGPGQVAGSSLPAELVTLPKRGRRSRSEELQQLHPPELPAGQINKGIRIKIVKSNITPVSNIRKRFLKCIKCNQNFATRMLRNEHEEAYHQSKNSSQRKCEFCKRVFNHGKSLATHKRLYHTGPNAGIRHVCKVCGVSYGLKGDLKTHERNVHGDLAKPHQCQICLKVFRNKRYCHSHLRVVHKKNSSEVAEGLLMQT